ncbi:putative nucleotidyltransferase substrate binding domain-containing protein [Tepidibacillus marianensis]|uniref:putative nucleotidyltransferase substrate binding domain-containing protein n=1 Tax=Tepidibacillus marianensis TaxID=3131995 RepID=UPI00338D7E11
MHFVNGLRMLAFKNGIHELNSWERIEALRKIGVITPDEADELSQAFDDLMLFRIKNKSHYLHSSHLSKKERIQLKKALMTARWFQNRAIRSLATPGSHLRGF